MGVLLLSHGVKKNKGITTANSADTVKVWGKSDYVGTKKASDRTSVQPKHVRGPTRIPVNSSKSTADRMTSRREQGERISMCVYVCVKVG